MLGCARNWPKRRDDTGCENELVEQDRLTVVEQHAVGVVVDSSDTAQLELHDAPLRQNRTGGPNDVLGCEEPYRD